MFWHSNYGLVMACALGLLPVIFTTPFKSWYDSAKTTGWPTWLLSPLQIPQKEAVALLFRWSSIDASSRLTFQPCFDGFECARLEVPMNWNSTYHSDDKVAIAIIRLPAKVPLTDPRHGGPLMIQPGGPGASGVNFILPTARGFQKVVDGVRDEDRNDAREISDGTAKYFDILSFDPRGINNTTPFHNCISDPEEQRSWELESKSYIPGTPEISLDLMWARQEAISQSCLYHAKTNPNGSKIASFMGTPTVVRDMVEIAERYGEWREAQANASIPKLDPAAAERLRWKKGEEPLRLWAMSYGSVIGATFAAMQPHRAHRLVLDAVVDSDAYYRGDWLHSVLDADALWSQFFTLCHASGPGNCPLHGNSSSAGAISDRWIVLERRLREDGPIPVPGTRDRCPSIITWSDFKNLVWWSSYSPGTRWKTVAHVLAPLLQGDGSAFADHKHKLTLSSKRIGLCPTINTINPDCAIENYTYRHVWQSVMCGDAAATTATTATPDGTPSMTPAAFRDHLATLQQQSAFLGSAWSWIRLVCAGWRGRAHWKADVPIQSDATAHPILWIGNTRDPVTPLRNALAMAARFPGSRVLELDAEGHGAIAGPSLCAARAVREYFQHGTLPEKGRRCLPQSRPFVGADDPSTEKYPDPLGREDEALLQAMQGIEAALP